MKYSIFLILCLFCACSVAKTDVFFKNNVEVNAVFPNSAYSIISLGQWDSNAGYSFTQNSFNKNGNGIVLWGYGFPCGVVLSNFKVERPVGINPVSQNKSYWFVDTHGNGSVLASTKSIGGGSERRLGSVTLYKTNNFNIEKPIFRDTNAKIISSNVDNKGNGIIILRKLPFEKKLGCCQQSYLSEVNIIEIKNHEKDKLHAFDLLEESEPFLNSEGNGFAIGRVEKNKIYTQKIQDYKVTTLPELKSENIENFKIFEGLLPAITWEVTDKLGKTLYIGSTGENSDLNVTRVFPLKLTESVKIVFYTMHNIGFLVTEDNETHNLSIRKIEENSLAKPQVIKMPPNTYAYFLKLASNEKGKGLLSWKQSPEIIAGNVPESSVYAQKIQDYQFKGEKISLAKGKASILDMSLSKDGNGLIVWSQQNTPTCLDSGCKAEVLAKVIRDYEPLVE